VGLFLNLTAVRSSDAAAVAEAVAGFAALHDVRAELLPIEADMQRKVALVVPPVNGWTVINWPRFIPFLLRASRWLSGEFNTIASAVDVFEGDDWSHVAISGGEVRDRYSTAPRNRVPPGTTSREANRRWGGNPRVVGETFGVDPDLIAPYFAGINIRIAKLLWHHARPSYSGKVWPDDEFPLWDVWVFADLWRRLGITYPDPDAAAGGHRIGVAYESFEFPTFPMDSALD
jgi:hypothetical protein